jgi:transcription initiation factor TFIID subunit TAF12
MFSVTYHKYNNKQPQQQQQHQQHNLQKQQNFNNLPAANPPKLTPVSSQVCKNTTTKSSKILPYHSFFYKILLLVNFY